jgi:cysteine desulfurase
MIYLDHHATTPLDPRVWEEMAPYFMARFGNPHSREHAIGWRASDAVEAARQEVAHAVGADSSEIIFTSGATEANNLALQGVGGSVLTTALEHPSVGNVTTAIKVRVESDGLVDPAMLAKTINRDTRVVSVALVNHEIGVIQPIASITRICHDLGVMVHTDCAQALGKLPINVHELGVDLASFSAHKAYGPMGIGALYIRRGVEISPLFQGGGQEMGLRAGTVPLPLAVGFGVAARLASQENMADSIRINRLRDLLLDRLRDGIDGLVVNGSMDARINGNLNLCLPAIDAESLLLELPEIAMSTGSACASGLDAPSQVLSAIGLSSTEVTRSLRLCLGRFTTEEEVKSAADRIISTSERLADSQSQA